MDTKECRMCGESKPVGIGGAFNKNGKLKDGSVKWHSYCKPCNAAKTREWQRENREKKREYKREYREANREVIREYQREYREQNREVLREQKRSYYEQNRERHLETQRAYREANREVLLEQKRVYREANREVLREKQRERSAKRLASWTPAEKAARSSVDMAAKRTTLDPVTLRGGATHGEAVQFTLPFAELRLKLEEETGKPHEIDHIVPICAGGLHVPENLQVIPRHANRSKGGYWDQADDDLTDEEIEAMEKEALEFTP